MQNLISSRSKFSWILGIWIAAQCLSVHVMAQKVDPYLRPLYDALYEMLGFDRVEKMLDKGIIEVPL